MTKIKCPVCENPGAEIRTTKQKEGAQRRMPPKAYLHCPDCGSLYSNKVAFSNRINAMLAAAQEKAAASGSQSDKKPDKTPAASGNQPPPESKPSFFGWSNRT